MKTFALRLSPHDDLYLSLQRWTAAKEVQAGCIVSLVGSLEQATLRFAGRSVPRRMKRDFEIVSCVGTLSPQGIHVHIAIADAWGKVWGGHLVEGCLINTTAEIILGELTDYRFERSLDRRTGYNELKILPASTLTTPSRWTPSGQFRDFPLEAFDQKAND